jgi:transcriptional regulator with XRE-family HTH domain
MTAETFRELLLARRVGASNNDFADRAGISARALADLLAGRVDRPRRATLLALAAALRVSPSRVEAAIAASRAAAQQ